jgi:hypothetical protein
MWKTLIIFLLRPPSIRFAKSEALIKAKHLIFSSVFVLSVLSGAVPAFADDDNIPPVWLLRAQPQGFVKLEMQDMKQCLLHLLSMTTPAETVRVSYIKGAMVIGSSSIRAEVFDDRDFVSKVADGYHSVRTMNGQCIKTGSR